MLAGGGVNQHMENSICFVVFIFESFPYQTFQSIERTIVKLLALALTNLVLDLANLVT